MVSLVAIESGTFMKEMGTAGHASTAGASFIVYSLLFLVVGLLTFKQLQGPRDAAGAAPAASGVERSFIVSNAALVAGSLAVVYLAIAGLKTGFPLLTGTDRFEFRANDADIVTLNLLNLKFSLGAMLGVGAAWSVTRGRTVLHHLVFALYILVSFLYGDKFFIVLIAASFYAMPFLVRNPRGIARMVRKLAPFVALVLLCVTGVTLFIYSGYGARSLDDTLTKLAGRIAGQGQLWFMAVEDSSNWINFDVDTVEKNLSSIPANPAATYVFEHRLAAFYFVEKYSPSAMYFSFLHNGGAVTPTMVFEAYGLVTFGYVGLAVLIAAMGMVVGALIHWLARAMMSGNPVNALLPAFVMSQTISLMSQATVYSVIGLSSFKAYAAFFVLQLIAAAWLKQANRGHAAVGNRPVSNP
jgi:hypothetical protein